jgi:hypothetical protein
MKTTSKENVLPVVTVPAFPALFRYTANNSSHGEVALFNHGKEGVVLISVNPDYPVGYVYRAVNPANSTAWERITMPFVITFDPTQ